MLFLSLVFCFTSGCQPGFKNPTSSMEGTIKRGQKFYVERTKKFRHNDIAVFDYFGNDYNSPPGETGHYQLKEQKRLMRIVAMSGDIFVIRHGEVYLNNAHLPLPPLGKTEYEIDSKIYLELRDPEEVSVTQSGDTFKYIAPLTEEEADGYANNKKNIFSIRKYVREVRPYDTFYARGPSSGTWSLDDYGPLKIPSPGDSVFVNDTNYKLYHNIPGVHSGLNIIKEELYFLMGDNRHFVEDSRFIGLISQSKMYGIVIE